MSSSAKTPKIMAVMAFMALSFSAILAYADASPNSINFTGLAGAPAQIQNIVTFPESAKVLVIQLKSTDGASNSFANVLVKFSSKAKARAAKQALFKSNLPLSVSGEAMAANVAGSTDIWVDADNVFGDRGHLGKPSLTQLADEQIRADELDKGLYLNTLSGWYNRWLDKGTCQGVYNTADCHDRFNKSLKWF